MNRRSPTPEYTAHTAVWFSRSVLVHNWPPGFVSQTEPPKVSPEVLSARAAKSRERSLANGNTGSINGISRKADEALVASKARRSRRRSRTPGRREGSAFHPEP